MAINYTTLLGLAQPVTGTESNVWGDVVNDSITALLDSAIAGTATINLTSGNVTLTDVDGAADQARMAILVLTGTPGVTTNVVAPSRSKTYIVVNQSNASAVLKGSATSGVTIRAGQAATCVWNGSDFEIVASGDVDGPSSATDNAVVRYDGTTGKLVQNSGVTIDDSNNVSGVVQLNATTVDTTNLEVTSLKAKDGTAAGSIADATGVVTLNSSVLTTTDINGGTIDGTTIGGTTPAAGSFTSLTDSGNLTFTGTGNRITGDFSNGTLANRVTFQTSAANSVTSVQAIPSGTGNTATFLAANGTDVDNSSIFQFQATNFDTRLNSNKLGTGTYLPMTFYTGGSERLRIDTSGNVGIGTSSFGGKLQVALGTSFTWGAGWGVGTAVFGGGSATSGALGISYNDTDGAVLGAIAPGVAWKDIKFNSSNLIFASGGTTERMRITSAGDVGIGTSSPINTFGKSLHLYTDANTGTVASNAYVNIESVNRNSVIELSGSSTATNRVNFSDTPGSPVAGLACDIANQSLFFTAGGVTERMRLDSSGNLGLGVNPSAWNTNRKALQIGGNTVASVSLGAAIGENLYNAYTAASNFIYATNGPAASVDFNNATSGGFAWRIAPSGTAGNAISFTQAMTLTSGGNLLVGGATDKLRLSVYSASANAPTLGAASGTALIAGSDPAYGLMMGTSGSGYSWMQAQRTDGTATAYDLLLQPSGGNLLVGTTSNPNGFKFLVSGSISATGSVSFPQSNNDTTAAAANMNIQGDGYLRRSTSALKYKQDIRDLESIDINLFRPVRYKSKCDADDQSKDHIGIIADEVAAAGIEELVNRGADGEVEGFQYERLTVVLLKNLQELKAEFDAYKAAHP